ncbi:MAG: hypothetical protein ACLP52_03885 [Streptosporangiaceae bacterium]
MVAATAPGPLRWLLHAAVSLAGVRLTAPCRHGLMLFMFVWLSASMGVAYLGKVTEKTGKMALPA